jgi:hypothetical protein
MRRRHISEREQLELFRALPGDLAARDAQDLMAWKHGGVKLSGHVKHGQAYGFGIVLHIGRRGAVPAGSDGATAATRSQSGPD